MSKDDAEKTDKPAPSKIVTKEETKPCGCHYIEYADKTRTISPCPPCGLMDAANNLNGAARALAAVATRLRMEGGRADVQAAVRAIHLS